MTRPGVPTVVVVLGVLALFGYVFVAVDLASPGRQAGSPRAAGAGQAGLSPALHPPPVQFPPAGKAFLGVQTGQGGYDLTDLDAFVAATGRAPSVLQFSQDWAHNDFDRTVFDRIAGRGMLPILSWEPWDYTAARAHSSGEQPEYRLARIVEGRYDGYLESWAEGIKSLDYPVAVRFGHEMNGFWYPWCEQANGNRKGDYVAAYRHVHDIFREIGADKVIWVWSPNVTYPGADPLRRLYPGDAYVDWVGLSGYYGTAGAQTYRSFNRIFADTFAEIRTFTGKPIVIAETGATDQRGERLRWVREMFTQLAQHPDVIGLIWFEARKELDWRLAGTPAAARAFGEGAAQQRYQVTWSTNTVPLRSVQVPSRPVTPTR